MVGALEAIWQRFWPWARRQAVAHSTVRTGGDKTETPWETVYVAANRLEAEVIRGRLESEDIPAVLHGEAAASIYGLTQGPLAQVAVRVPAPLAERARALLAEETAEAARDVDHG